MVTDISMQLKFKLTMIINSKEDLSFPCSHFNSLNLVQMSKTVQVLLTQVQEHIFEFNVGRSASADAAAASPSGRPLSTSEFESRDWNFPGLRKSSAPVFESRMESGDRAEEEKGIGEILLLQQRTVLQVSPVLGTYRQLFFENIVESLGCISLMLAILFL